ncbi:MAG: hypothetical protein WCK28_16430 [Burkholderiales bacterium]
MIRRPLHVALSGLAVALALAAPAHAQSKKELVNSQPIRIQGGREDPQLQIRPFRFL